MPVFLSKVKKPKVAYGTDFVKQPKKPISMAPPAPPSDQPFRAGCTSVLAEEYRVAAEKGITAVPRKVVAGSVEPLAYDRSSSPKLPPTRTEDVSLRQQSNRSPTQSEILPPAPLPPSSSTPHRDFRPPPVSIDTSAVLREHPSPARKDARLDGAVQHLPPPPLGKLPYSRLRAAFEMHAIAPPPSASGVSVRVVRFVDLVRIGAAAGCTQVDVGAFRSVDPDRSGYATFLQVLKCFHPGLSTSALRRCIEVYGPPRWASGGGEGGDGAVGAAVSDDWRKGFTAGSLAECIEMYRVFGGQVNPQQQHVLIHTPLEHLGSNGNERGQGLSLQQLRKALSNNLIRDSELERMFSDCDVDGDKLLNLKEFGSLLHHIWVTGSSPSHRPSAAADTALRSSGPAGSSSAAADRLNQVLPLALQPSGRAGGRAL